MVYMSPSDFKIGSLYYYRGRFKETYLNDEVLLKVTGIINPAKEEDYYYFYSEEFVLAAVIARKEERIYFEPTKFGRDEIQAATVWEVPVNDLPLYISWPIKEPEFMERLKEGRL
jgi:hypothetical protein